MGQLTPCSATPAGGGEKEKAGETERLRMGGGEREPPAPSGRPNAPGTGQRAPTAARNRRPPVRMRCPRPAPQAEAPPLRRCRPRPQAAAPPPPAPWRVRVCGDPAAARGRARRRVAMDTWPPPSRPGLGVCVLPSPGGGGAGSVRKRPGEEPRGQRGVPSCRHLAPSGPVTLEVSPVIFLQKRKPKFYKQHCACWT